jgi:hypothetical protein
MWRNDMTKKSSSIEVENFERFMKTMVRVLGISRKKLDSLMFPRLPTRDQRYRNVQQNRGSSKRAAI